LPAPAADPLNRYRPWLFAAAAYNLAWGGVNVVWPSLIFDLLDVEHPNYLALWQVVGMLVLVFAPAYWWAGRYPSRHPHLVAIGLLGKLLGPAGFVWAVATDRLPLAFGLTILTNDLVWWPAFSLYLLEAARLRGGWRVLLAGR